MRHLNPTSAAEPLRKRAKFPSRPSAEKNLVMSDGDSACSHEQQPSLSDQGEYGDHLKQLWSGSLPGQSDQEPFKPSGSAPAVPRGSASAGLLVHKPGEPLAWPNPYAHGPPLMPPPSLEALARAHDHPWNPAFFQRGMALPFPSSRDPEAGDSRAGDRSLKRPLQHADGPSRKV